MVRIISSFLLLVLSFQCSFGKAVDENTARTVTYNFCKSEHLAMASSQFSLVYTATSVINGAQVVDFYVFNASTPGFVIISGDDNVLPVLAYSTEAAFGADIPVTVAEWLEKYKQQINSVIKKNTPATTGTNEKWKEMLSTNVYTAARTTSGSIVLPMVKTFWNQMPYYNALCPYDAGAGTNAITGCVATAMAQVMKYWSWPRRGVGSHSYNSSYGTLSADFGNTVYQWDSMPNAIGYVDTPIAQLMYQAGVSVNMSYSPTESGAFVNTNTSPIPNCAQYALVTYFSYKSSTIQGVFRSAYTDSDWVHMLKAEVDAGRPSIYTGDGSSGGHCWVADGYESGDRIHFNWGWGGTANGYYTIENLDPANTDFNSGQTLMTGIEPDSTLIAGVKEVAPGTSGLNIYPNPATEFVNIDLGNTKTTGIRIMDMAGRELEKLVPSNNESVVTIPVNSLATGMYFVELQSAEGVLTRKIAVAR